MAGLNTGRNNGPTGKENPHPSGGNRARHFMGKSNQDRVTRLLSATVMLAVLTVTAATRQSAAQRKTKAAPYDSIAIDGENYAGPARGSAWDETGSTVYVGLLAPMHGLEAAEGEALVAAAKLALKDSTQRPLHGGRRIELAIGDESGPAWEHVSDVMLQLVQQKNVVALITSTNGTDTHVSEQVGNRIGVPILTLSDDTTTTEIDIPWIFRVGPSDLHTGPKHRTGHLWETRTEKSYGDFRGRSRRSGRSCGDAASSYFGGSAHARGNGCRSAAALISLLL